MDGEGAIFDEELVQRARSTALSEGVTAEIAETFKVLASPTRIRLLRALSVGELCVNDLAAVLGMSISATSHQLRALKTAKIVSARTAGKHTYYGLRDTLVGRLLTDCLVNNGMVAPSESVSARLPVR